MERARWVVCIFAHYALRVWQHPQLPGGACPTYIPLQAALGGGTHSLFPARLQCTTGWHSPQHLDDAAQAGGGCVQGRGRWQMGISWHTQLL